MNVEEAMDLIRRIQQESGFLNEAQVQTIFTKMFPHWFEYVFPEDE